MASDLKGKTFTSSASIYFIYHENLKGKVDLGDESKSKF